MATKTPPCSPLLARLLPPTSLTPACTQKLCYFLVCIDILPSLGLHLLFLPPICTHKSARACQVTVWGSQGLRIGGSLLRIINFFLKFFLVFCYRLGLAVIRFGDRRQFGSVQLLCARFFHGSFRLVVHAHSCAEITEIRGVFAPVTELLAVALPHLTFPTAALAQVASRACDSKEFFYFYSSLLECWKSISQRKKILVTIDGWSHSYKRLHR